MKNTTAIVDNYVVVLLVRQGPLGGPGSKGCDFVFWLMSYGKEDISIETSRSLGDLGTAACYGVTPNCKFHMHKAVQK